jgi:hypothetical protein
MKVFASLRDDAHQGWVWLQKPDLPARSIVKITNPKSGRTVYCESLQIESNFLEEYNQKPRVPITDPSSSIVLNGWYRAFLGGIATQSEYDLSVKLANGPWGKFRACTHHPQAVVRVAAWLGLLSIVLGLISVFLGVTSLLGADWKYQTFNSWGIVFQYPKSFKQLSEADLLKMKLKLSRELDFVIKEGLALCGDRFIQDFTSFTASDKFEVALSVMRVQFKKAPNVDCFLRERRISVKPEYNLKLLRLEKTRLGGYDAIIEDIEIMDRSNRSVGLHILAGMSIYEIGWFVRDKNKFRDWEIPLLHLINTIKIERR